MARVFGYLLAFLLASSSVSAVPVEPRQIGGIGCNVARLKTVTGLRQTTNAVNKIASSGDPAAADAATTAQGGLQDASDGIKTIAGALLTGQQAPAAARDQVSQGLLTAQTALNNITTTDSAVTSMVEDAKSKLEKTISAGQDVVAKCGGGGGAANANAGGAAATGTGDNTSNNGGNSTSAGTDESSDAPSTDSSSTDTPDNAGSADTPDNAGSADTPDNAGSADTPDNAGSADTPDNAGSADGTSTDSTGTNDGDTSTTQGNTSPDTSTPAKGSNNPAGLSNSRIFGKRQIGGVACNVARFQTVSRLAQSSSAVNAVKNAASGDAATVAAAGQASTALNSAKGAIGRIAAALLTGQKAPAAERDKVESGLNDAMTALSSINSTDPNVTSAVSAAQDKVSSTIEAGQGVVSNC